MRLYSLGRDCGPAVHPPLAPVQVWKGPVTEGKQMRMRSQDYPKAQKEIKTIFDHSSNTLVHVYLVLFVFISIHQTFNSEKQFQTKKAYVAENFLLINYHWMNANHPHILAHSTITTAVFTQLVWARAY